MDRLVARAEIAERLRNFATISMAMRASDVAELTDWLKSENFTATCRAAVVDPHAVAREFEKLVSRGLESNLSFL